jgi:aspartate carbamoyltransferase catalytic subunit
MGLEAGQDYGSILAGRTVALAFFEPSTRTRLSFDLAAQRLGAHVITFNPGTSSTTKGETLRDTVLTIGAIGADIVVVRHSEEGVPELVEGWTGLPVVNAGDGANEHPTQALLDALTIKRHFGRLEGLRVGIVGDIAHSRVAGSLINALPALGLDLTLVAPGDWLPPAGHLRATSDLEGELPGLDIVYLLRVQTERGGEISDDYIDRFQMDTRRSALLPEDAVIMHPGPMNRGVEIAEAVADSPRSLIIEQVRNGVPTRMAVLASLGGQS